MQSFGQICRGLVKLAICRPLDKHGKLDEKELNFSKSKDHGKTV